MVNDRLDADTLGRLDPRGLDAPPMQRHPFDQTRQRAIERGVTIADVPSSQPSYRKRIRTRGAEGMARTQVGVQALAVCHHIIRRNKGSTTA